jgi:hypothetical protein
MSWRYHKKQDLYKNVAIAEEGALVWGVDVEMIGFLACSLYQEPYTLVFPTPLPLHPTPFFPHSLLIYKSLLTSKK